MTDKLLTTRAEKQKLDIKIIENMFVKVKKWANENGMIFDLDKFEVTYFLYKKVFYNPDIRLLSLILPRHNIPEEIIRLVEKKH